MWLFLAGICEPSTMEAIYCDCRRSYIHLETISGYNFSTLIVPQLYTMFLYVRTKVYYIFVNRGQRSREIKVKVQKWEVFSAQATPHIVPLLGRGQTHVIKFLLKIPNIVT